MNTTTVTKTNVNRSIGGVCIILRTPCTCFVRAKIRGVELRMALGGRDDEEENANNGCDNTNGNH